MDISKNATRPSLLEKGKGLRQSKARFLEMPLLVTTSSKVSVKHRQ
jgi:hypothetical protein